MYYIGEVLRAWAATVGVMPSPFRWTEGDRRELLAPFVALITLLRTAVIAVINLAVRLVLLPPVVVIVAALLNTFWIVWFLDGRGLVEWRRNMEREMLRNYRERWQKRR